MYHMAEKKATRAPRTRNWSCIIYPESAPTNWRDVIDSEHIEWVESPLHDADLNADNSEKKQHWHILLSYESHKTFEQVLEITQKLNAPIPQKVASPKGLVRYMIHLDNPEKKQYSKSKIIGHGGVDVSEYFKNSFSDDILLWEEICDFCAKENITELKHLVDYSRINRRDDWFPLIVRQTMFISMYLKSRRHFQDKTKQDVSALVKKATEV